MFPDAHGMTPSPPSRTFEQYRYAIEAGLISPHVVRCYVPAWERSPATEATTAGTRARAGKRYHDSEDDYAETVEDDGWVCQFCLWKQRKDGDDTEPRGDDEDAADDAEDDEGGGNEDNDEEDDDDDDEGGEEEGEDS